MARSTTARLGLVVWDSDEDALGTFREDLVANAQAIDLLVARLTDLAAETTARQQADTDLGVAVASKLDTTTGGTVAGALAVTGVFRPNGGIAPTDGSLEITGSVAISSAVATLNGVQIATTADVTGGTANGAKTNVANTFTALQTFGAGLALSDGQDVTIGTGTGSKIGQAASKLGFFGAAPAAKPGATAELKAALAGLGLLTDGSATPLDLDGGALTAGAGTFSGAVGITGLLTATGGISLPNGVDVTVGTGTGSRIGQASSKLGFFGATPVARPGSYSVDASTVTDRTLAAYTTANATQSSAYTGAAGDGEAKLADLNALRSAHEVLRAYVEDVAQLAAAHTRDLQALGTFG